MQLRKYFFIYVLIVIAGLTATGVYLAKQYGERFSVQVQQLEQQQQQWLSYQYLLQLQRALDSEIDTTDLSNLSPVQQYQAVNSLVEDIQSASLPISQAVPIMTDSATFIKELDLLNQHAEHVVTNMYQFHRYPGLLDDLQILSDYQTLLLAMLDKELLTFPQQYTAEKSDIVAALSPAYLFEQFMLIISVILLLSVVMVVLACYLSLVLKHLFLHNAEPLIYFTPSGKIKQMNLAMRDIIQAVNKSQTPASLNQLLYYEWPLIQQKITTQVPIPWWQLLFGRGLPQSEQTATLHDVTLNLPDDTVTHYQMHCLVMHTLSGVMILGRLIDQSQLLAVRKEMERDQSTGIYNKSVIMERLHTEMERANRHQYALSVLFFDIDNFKQFNDQYGHQFGDEIIKEVIGAISTRKRDTDLLGRFGGDEFLLICPECNAKQAESLSKDVLNILKQGNQEVTLSIGIVQMELEEKPGDVLLKADLAMYEAKQLGKNRAVTAGLLRPANQS